MTRLTVLAMVGAARVAHADPFVASDRVDRESRVLLELKNLVPPGRNQTAFVSELHGQYAGASGFGGYGHVYLGYVDMTRSRFGLSDLDVGGFYTHAATSSLELVGRVGVALDTATDSPAGGGLRLQDAVLRYGRWVRASGSMILRSDRSVARLDIGADTDAASPPQRTVALHAAAAFGFAATPDAIVTAELTSVWYSGGSSLAAAIAGGASFRYAMESWQAYAAVLLPINHQLRQGISIDATIGVARALR